MASSREEFIKKRGASRKCFPWANVLIDWDTLRVETALWPNNGVRPYDIYYPARVPYPSKGFPTYLGQLEGKTKTNPGYNTEENRYDLSLNPEEMFFSSQKETIDMTLLWCGDTNIEKLIEERGPGDETSKGGGGSPNPITTNLLLIYVDGFDPLYGYDEERPVVITYKLFWKIAMIPPPLENDGLPERWQFQGVALAGKNQATGQCFPPGMQLFNRYRMNLQGQLVKKNGTVINPNVPSPYIPIIYPSLPGTI